MTWVSFAQAGEDVLLRRALGHIADGFWVDVGAGDPEVDSVTAHLSSLGWRGINIEPDREACARLAAARPRDITLCCAAGAAPGRAVLHRIAGTGLSTLAPDIAARHAEAGFAPEPVEVEVRTLAEICDAHAPATIHVLKVDAEGHEAAVLAGADFARHRPWVVVAEATEPNSTAPAHAAWEPGLLAAGYVFVWFDGLNRWYLAEERAGALRGAFTTPPNPHDGFVRRAEVAWQQRAEAAEAWGQREAAARAEAETALADAHADAAQAAARGARAMDAAAAAARDAAERAARHEAAARAEREAMASDRAAAEAALTRAEARVEAAETEVALAASALADAEARAAAAEAETAAAHRRIRAMEHSRSWRVTWPLRVIGNTVRGWSGLALVKAGAPRTRAEAWKATWEARRQPPPSRALSSAAPAPPTLPRPEGRPAICMDVTLTLRHGGGPAVGLVRVEHDVARHLLSLR